MTSIARAAFLFCIVGGWLTSLSAQTTSLSIIPANDSSVNNTGGIGGPDTSVLIQNAAWLDILTFPAVTKAQSGKSTLAGTGLLTLSSVYNLTPGTLVAIQIYGSPLAVTASSSPNYAQLQSAGLTDFGLATGVVQSDDTTLPFSGPGLDAWLTARDQGSSQAASLVLPYFGLGDAGDYFSATNGPQPELLTADLVVPEPSACVAALIAAVVVGGVLVRRHRIYAPSRA